MLSRPGRSNSFSATSRSNDARTADPPDRNRAPQESCLFMHDRAPLTFASAYRQFGLAAWLHRFGRHQLTRSAIAVACVVATLLLVWPVLTRAVTAWSTYEAFGFGFLLAPLAAFLAWRRRHTFDRGASAGLAVVFVGLSGLLLAERVWARAPAAVSAGFLVVGIVIYLWGWRAGRAVAGPLALLTYALVLEPTLIAPLAFALQNLTAVGASGVVQILGMAVQRSGLVVSIPAGDFLIAEACSGMSSLFSMLALSGVWLHLISAPLVRRIALLMAVPPIVVLANLARVTLVLLVADRFGQEAAMDVFHGASSLLLFALALASLAAVSRALGCRPQLSA
jgi:exosortase